jgi:hypothetical protein
VKAFVRGSPVEETLSNAPCELLGRSPVLPGVENDSSVRRLRSPGRLGKRWLFPFKTRPVLDRVSALLKAADLDPNLDIRVLPRVSRAVKIGKTREKEN